MTERVPLEFTCYGAEEHIRLFCIGREMPFESLEPAIHAIYLLVPAGHQTSVQVEVGRQLMECPSKELDQACYDYVKKTTAPLVQARIEERRRQTAAGIPDPLAEFEAEWRKKMGFEVFDEIDEWLTGLRREGLPLGARRELAKRDHKSKVKHQLRVVK